MSVLGSKAVPNFDDEDELRGPSVNVRCGSGTDLQRHAHLRLLSGVKQTSNVRFLSPPHSCADDVCFQGQSGPPTHGPKESAYSQEETFRTSWKSGKNGQNSHQEPAPRWQPTFPRPAERLLRTNTKHNPNVWRFTHRVRHDRDSSSPDTILRLLHEEIDQGIEKVSDTRLNIQRTLMNKVLDKAGRLASFHLGGDGRYSDQLTGIV